jgi:hypothetical protein
MAAAVVTRGRKHKPKRQRIGLSCVEEERLKARLRQHFPSEPWIEHTVKRFEDVKADGQVIVYRFHDAKAFPPAGDHVRMVRCPECGRTVPPNSLEHGVCLDHASTRTHESYGSSPSAHAILTLQHRNLRIEGVKLKRESTKALKREIQRFKSGAWTKGG